MGNKKIGKAVAKLLVATGMLNEKALSAQLRDWTTKAVEQKSGRRKASIESIANPNLRLLATRLTDVLVEQHPEDTVESLRQAIGSRKLGIYVEMEVPILNNKKLVFDTRVDNGASCPNGLLQLTSGTNTSPWPVPQTRPITIPVGGDPRVEGCPGSSCPRTSAESVINGTWDTAQVPVDIVAFHAEGHNGEVAYSVRMFSDVSGRLEIPIVERGATILSQSANIVQAASKGGLLEIAGQMVVTVVPDKPEDFGGMDRIELVSQGVVTQTGRMSQWPPALGDYLQTVGSEAYSLMNSRELPLALVRQGRIIFSDEEDPFLQARTRVHTFVFTDQRGQALALSANSEDIRGVRLIWNDVRSAENRVTHYQVYSAIWGDRATIRLLADNVTDSQFVDSEYDGTRTISYSIVPCTRNILGDVVDGIGLDFVSISFVRVTPAMVTDVELVRGNLGFR